MSRRRRVCRGSVKSLIAVMWLASVTYAQEPMDAVKNVYSDKKVTEAKEFVRNVDGKMPLWDVDRVGQYERDAIVKVKFDISVCAADVDVPEFMDHVDTLNDDWDTLLAIDDKLKRDQVI